MASKQYLKDVERRKLEAKQRREREKERRKKEQQKKEKDTIIDRIVYRNEYLILNYGITLKQYDELFRKQKACCAICGRHDSQFKKRLGVDHDHKTGIIRGLLCTGCNIVLGHYEKHENEYKYYLIHSKEHGIIPKF